MEQRHNRKLHYNSKRFNPLEWAIYTPYLISSFLQRPSDFSGGSKITEHSHKVPGSTESMNGVEGRHFIKLWYEWGIHLWNNKLLCGTRP